MRNLQELAARRDQIIAEQNALCGVDVWTDEQQRRYYELEDERCAIVDELSDANTIELLKDENADLARLIYMMSAYCFDVTEVEERIANNFRRITKIEREYDKV